MALRFFARANWFSRTPSAFAEFQATTRGTATQTIKALEAGGYLVRQRLESDGRSVSLQLTDKGREALARDPFEVLARKEQVILNEIVTKGRLPPASKPRPRMRIPVTSAARRASS
jgi:DNA-binding MarR family transcriptional regulator